jgi:tripartite-type tricarboxylate transporter receptor subunit TctC
MTDRKQPGSAAVAALLLALGVQSPSANAQSANYPTKPIRYLVGYTPAGTADMLARAVGGKLTEAWGQQVIVENRPGGQNIIGAQLAARTTPDGHNYFFATTAAIVMNPFTFKSLPYDPQKDFAPVAMIALSPFVLAVNAAVPAKSLAELIALDKAQPGKLALANEGPRTFSGMMGQMLNLTAGMKLLSVPYVAPPPAITDTVGGRTQVVLVSSAAITPYLKRGDLRALAVTAGKRVPGLEQVPTLAETFPGFVYVGWYVLLAPTGVPAKVAQRVNRDVDRVVADPDVISRLREMGQVTEGAGTPATIAIFLASERERWMKTVHDVGIKPE